VSANDYVLDACVLIHCALPAARTDVVGFVDSAVSAGSRVIVVRHAWEEVRRALWRFANPSECERLGLPVPSESQWISHNEAVVRLELLRDQYLRPLGTDLAADDTDFEQRAWAISRELRHPISDCIYLAVAKAWGHRVLTTDGALVDAIERAAGGGGPDYRKQVRLLAPSARRARRSKR
jgi:predicted nucleic acid-binding protein